MNYFAGNVIVVLSSIISFPILTRILSVGDYGTLAIIMSTLTIVFALAKLGIQNSVVRYHAEYALKGPESLREFYSTVLFSLLSTGTIAMLLYLATIPWVSQSILKAGNTRVFYFAALLIPAHCFYSVVYNFYWARQDPLQFNVSNILESYLPLLFGIALLYLEKGKLEWFIVGAVVGRVCYAIYYGRRMVNIFNVKLGKYSHDILLKSFQYGFPLMLFELSSNLLAYGDRYLIKYYMTMVDLGIYVVGYNLSMYISNIIANPVNRAVQSRYMEIWSVEGKIATEVYLSKIIVGIVALYFLVVSVSIGVFPDLLQLLASKKYAESAKVAPFVISSLLLFALYPIFGAGIYLEKRTRVLLAIVTLSLGLNVVLNLILIPMHGIMGAAEATFGSYIFAFFMIRKYSSNSIRIKTPYRTIVLCVTSGTAAYLMMGSINFQYRLANVVSKGTAGVVIYAGLVTLFDPTIRDYLRVVFRSLNLLPALNKRKGST